MPLTNALPALTNPASHTILAACLRVVAQRRQETNRDEIVVDEAIGLYLSLDRAIQRATNAS